MGHHRHLTLEEREMVLKFQTLGYSIVTVHTYNEQIKALKTE